MSFSPSTILRFNPTNTTLCVNDPTLTMHPAVIDWALVYDDPEVNRNLGLVDHNGFPRFYSISIATSGPQPWYCWYYWQYIHRLMPRARQVEDANRQQPFQGDDVINTDGHRWRLWPFSGNIYITHRNRLFQCDDAIDANGNRCRPWPFYGKIYITPGNHKIVATSALDLRYGVCRLDDVSAAELSHNHAEVSRRDFGWHDLQYSDAQVNALVKHDQLNFLLQRLGQQRQP